MRRTLLLAVVVLATPALAASWKEKMSEAADQLDSALQLAKDSSGYCRQAVSHGIRKASDRVDELRKNPTEDQLKAVQSQVAALGLAAAPNGCSPELVQKLDDAQRDLERARHMLERHRHHHGDGDDDDDEGDDDHRPPPGPPPGPPALAEMAPLRAEFVDGPGHANDMMRLSTQVTLRGMGNQQWTLAWRARAENGAFSDWSRSERVAAPGPFSTVEAAGVFPIESLRATGARSFVGEVAVLNRGGLVMASRQLPFSLPGRDCGTGPDDPGCNRARDGRWPMDRRTHEGLMASMAGNAGEHARRDMAMAVFRANYLTARQLGDVLGRFMSDNVKLELSRAAAPHVVDPENALALASKFRSTLLQRDFTALFSGAPPPPPTGPPPGNQPPPPPPSQVRTCGSDDPGCPMTRNGQYSMDRRAFDGFVDAMRANSNELNRKDMALSVLAHNYITARQLGQLLPLFNNEIIKLEVARAAAPHVVNPLDSLGLSRLFSSSLSQRDYVQLMSSQH